MQVSLPELRVGFLGCPARPEIEWSDTTVGALKALGINTAQLNIAWGSRPGDEALNLEDLVELPSDRAKELAGATEMLGDQSPERRAWRKEEFRKRIALCRRHGLRTIFHFGAPYIGDQYISDAPGNCLLDGKTLDRCIVLLERFAAAFPGVDDILIYTYDQHAWLCSEFGPCPRCTGKPLHERVVPFLEKMAATWRKSNPEGRLWWEPWELSAGQVLKCVEIIEPEGFGLSLHGNIAEVMSTFPVDRWLRNTVALAAGRGIPAIAECWLGGPSEEVEPYTHLAYPLVTLRGLRQLADVARLAGIKEYYGLLPDQEDPNLRMTGLFFADPEVGEDEALETLAQPYAEAAEGVKDFWRLTSEAMELFPWETSWIVRAIGHADPAHSLSAAIVKGVPWHTPSWCSTRRNTFMVVDTADEPDPWMLEDIQLRCDLAAQRMERALEIGDRALPRVPEALASGFGEGLRELREMRRRVMAYVYHARETNLATVMRALRQHGSAVPEELWTEMQSLLERDQANQEQDEPIASALALLRSDPDQFLERYFTMDTDGVSRHPTSLTSR